ncbi:hypothetical protein FRC04_002100 [Tulasnella sp. 424]|nr:hypothetical protein FRC04_002100 [Tulasnella sp. 424]KAG8967986.1 hypothetical protein FRC05_001696 [Tulasnella sp. 425]
MDKKRFGTYGLSETSLARAMALYPRVELMTNPSRGLNVPTIAVAPICALVACEETGSNKVTERVAQAVSCLAPAEFSKALRTVRTALADADRKAKSATTVLGPQKQNSTPVKKPTTAKSRLLGAEPTMTASQRDKPSPSATVTRQAKIHTFESMCKRYGMDATLLCPSLERIYDHMSRQGWDAKKWKDNEGPIRCAIFYWVCNFRNRKLRDLPIICEELSAPLRLVQNVIKSMESIRAQLAPLAGAEPTNPPTPSRSLSPASSSLKRKAENPATDSGSASASREPSPKRIRTESVHSEPGASDDDVIPQYEDRPSRSERPTSRTSEDIDGESLLGTMSSSGRSYRHQQEVDPDVDIVEVEATPRGRRRTTTATSPSKLSTAGAAKRSTHRVSGPPVNHDEASMDLEEQPVVPRYRPVFPDRSFYAATEQDSTIGEEHSWRRWLEDKRKVLGAP